MSTTKPSSSSCRVPSAVSPDVTVNPSDPCAIPVMASQSSNSSQLSVPPTRDDIEAAAWCAVTARPQPGETLQQAHLRINASLAGHHQLEQFRLNRLTQVSTPTSPPFPDVSSSGSVPSPSVVSDQFRSTTVLPRDTCIVLSEDVGPVSHCLVTTVVGDGDKPQGNNSSSATSNSSSAIPVASPASPQPTNATSSPSSGRRLPMDVPSRTPSPAEPIPSAALAGHSQYPFYAVARGIVPGVYTTWSECWANTHAVSGNMHKGFVDYNEAVAFVNEFKRVLKRSASAKSRLRDFRAKVPSDTSHQFECSTHIVHLVDHLKILPSVVSLAVRTVVSIPLRLRDQLAQAVTSGADSSWTTLHTLCARLSPEAAKSLVEILILFTQTPPFRDLLPHQRAHQLLRHMSLKFRTPSKAIFTSIREMTPFCTDARNDLLDALADGPQGNWPWIEIICRHLSEADASVLLFTLRMLAKTSEQFVPIRHLTSVALNKQMTSSAKTSKRRRKKNYGWTLKGTKASRSESRRGSAAAARITAPIFPSQCDASGTLHNSSSATRIPIPSTQPVLHPPDAPAPDSPSAYSSASQTPSSASQVPGVRTAKAVYAYAEGLTTTLEFPQRFLVSLSGEEPLPDGAPSSTDPLASSAISAVISAVKGHVSDPSSLCNHPGCIFNMGSVRDRRARHVEAIRLIDDLPYDKSSPVGTKALVSALSTVTGDILDSGAARHVEPSKHRFASISACAPVTLLGINGPASTITQHGSVGGFRHVLFAPSAAASVRSVSSLIDSHACNVLFTYDGAYLYKSTPAPKDSIQIAKRQEDGLFHIIKGAVPAPTASALLSVANQIKRERVHQLHRTLAHASPARMRQVLTQHPQIDPSLVPKDVLLFTSCPACALGNAVKRARPPKASIRATAFAYRLHFDTSGVVRPSTASGYTRVLIGVDDASRWYFVSLLKSATMAAVSAAMRAILRVASTTHSVLRTKVVRCDNGTEFKNTLVDSLLAECNVEREYTCVGTSHQNGVAESALGTVFAMARKMLVDASLPPRFWGEAVLAAVHVHNRLPTSANTNNLSPYEVRYGTKPDLRHLRPFGISAYVRIQKHITKVMPRAVSGVLLGYGHAISSQKGWRILLPDLGKVVTTTDATFSKSLQQSVASRPSDLTSADVITIDDGDAFSSTSNTAVSPANLPKSLATTPEPPTTRSVTRAAVKAAASASALTTPKPDPDRPSTPVRPSTQVTAVNSSPPSSTSSVPPTITKPELSPETSDVPVATPIVHRRPVGRPPSGCRWDEFAGRYVPILASARLPTQAQVWALVTRKVDPDDRTPQSYHEAVTGPDAVHWIQAIQEELASLRARGTWKPMPVSAIPPQSRRIKTKWVFKLKLDTDGNIVRYKARLVVCGYAQKFGRDYEETFAPVASSTSIRSVFAIAAARGMHLSQHDIDLAFLYGVLPESQRVYLFCPLGVDLPEDQCLVCILALYGLKQAPRLFNLHLQGVLGKLHYTQSLSDPCVYFKRVNGELSILAIVVDDILHAASSPQVISDFSESMAAVYKMKNLGTPSLMVGIKVKVTSDSLRLSQAHYVRQVAETFRQLDAAPAQSPASQHGCLGPSPSAGGAPLDTSVFPYLSLVGSLLWVTITRPDIAAAVGRACKHSKAPTNAHWRAAIRILRYLLATNDLSLVYPVRRRPITVTAYADAAYGNELAKRSRYGHAVYISGCLVCWLTKATSSVCLSTAEAEYIAATEATKDVVWVRNFLAELGFRQTQPSKLFEDNQACVAMVNNHVVTGRNRHFCVKMAWLRQQVANKVVSFVFVASKNNVADILTKILPPEAHARLARILLDLRDVSPRGGGVEIYYRLYIPPLLAGSHSTSIS